MNTYIKNSVVILCIYLLSTVSLLAQEVAGDQEGTKEGAEESGQVSSDWPREIKIPKGVVVVYQPQPESLDGHLLKGRAAVAVEMKDAKEPVFGAIWFEAQLDTDRAERSANITQVSVTRVRFPTEDEKKSERLITLLEKEIPLWQFAISIDQLMLTLEREDKRSDIADRISTKPPKIIFIDEPAVLITIDGEPHLKKELDSDLMRVINTPYTIVFDPDTKHYYLNADQERWYSTEDIKVDWQLAKEVPDAVFALAPVIEYMEVPGEESESMADSASIPKVIVVTEPAELISATGEAKFTPVDNTDLLYLSNTESDVLKSIKDQNYYVLLSGRWYASTDLNGPWKYVAGEDLPEDFSRIPEDSEMGTVLYAVPGTDIAEEAILDTQIPQTAAVDRNKATLSVVYDGYPMFEAIEGSSLSYSTNTETPVIKVNNKYYAVDDAVWFVSKSANGSWKVATSVPDEIYNIPPESPLYHVTFVRIYNVTDDEVYTGYTPGYTGTYVYHNTIIYGTGYYWPGWYRYWYYPRRSTWGYHARWNPYSGFRFGLSYSSGPFTFGIGGGGWYRGGWWGPGRYRGYHNGYRHGHRAGYRSGQRNATRNNIYRSQNNKARISTRAGSISKGAKGSHRANNVFADKDGNIHRKSAKGWDQRTADGWKPESGNLKSRQAGVKDAASKQKLSQAGSVKKQTKAAKQVPSWHSSVQSLDRSSQSRQRGAQRSRSSMQASGSARGGMSGGGGMRGGGMRGGGRR